MLSGKQINLAIFIAQDIQNTHKQSMRPIKLNAFIVLVMLLFSVCSTLQAQVTGTYTSTTSICFNDGTITVVPGGGTAPYTLSIISGPVYQNYPYPVNLPAGVYQFQNVPKGTFTIQITDAGGQTGQIAATVAGLYTFPVITTAPTIIYDDSISVNVTGGMKPFQYAISSTNSFSGFSTYQQDSVFRSLCNGNYWVRVRDNCGNIYTKSVFLNSGITQRTICINYDTGYIHITASGGTPPFTYTISKLLHQPVTNQSGIFDLFPSSYYDISITDKCGRNRTYQLGKPSVLFRIPCPFTGSIELRGASGNSIFDPVITCTNCIPVQQYATPVINRGSNNPINIFTGLLPDKWYYLETVDECGNIWRDSLYTKGVLKPKIDYLSCASFHATFFDDNNNQVIPKLVTAQLGSHIYKDSAGYFYHLPQFQFDMSRLNHTVVIAAMSDISGMADSWAVTGISDSGCSVPSQNVPLPYMGVYEGKFSMDSLCSITMDYYSIATVKDLPDIYSLISEGDTFQEIPPTPGNVVNFNNITFSDSLFLISDSGCAVLFKPSPINRIYNNLSSTVLCGGGRRLLIRPNYILTESPTFNNPTKTDSLVIELYDNNDVLIYDSAIRYSLIYAELTPPDTGWFNYKLYFKNKPNPYGMNAYDSICPFEQGSIYITDKIVPFPLTTNLYKCPQDSPVTYTVYGGAIPYTVIIPGVDTFTQQTNTAVFPRQTPGQYTIIVYDDCGISRSMSFSVIDTCTICVTADTSMSGGTVCTADTIRLKNRYSGVAISHTWQVNGIVYSNSADTIFIPGSEGNYVFTYTVANDSCADSVQMTYRVKAQTGLTLGSDTGYCGNFSRILAGASPSTIWSTGQTGSRIRVSQAGTYTALDSSGCTIIYDTIVIRQTVPPVFDLGSDTAICQGQSIVLDIPVSGATFNWSNGNTDSFLVVTDTVKAPIAVTVTQSGCSTADTISVAVLSIQHFSLGADTVFCDSVSYTLNSPVNNPVQWSDGSTAGTFNISAPGIYWAEAVTACGTFRDSIAIGLDSTPQFELIADRFFVCNSKDDSVLLKAVADSSGSAVIFSWNGGSKTDSMVYVSELYIKQTGVYSATAGKGKCIALKEITLMTDSCPAPVCKEGFAVPNVFTPNGDNVNDEFKVICPCDVESFEMKIYNRWGQLVFLSNSIHEGWNGTYKNTIQNQETYLVTIDISTAQAGHQKLVSKLSLIQ
jgi:gliding motility-associated-like protein